MNDRELLELAATAAGIEIERDGDAIFFYNEFRDVWAPLMDDGDALRLAVKLDISIRQHFAMVKAEYPWIEDYCTRKVLCEGVLDDYCAATRRAIVRAAAEIGKRVDTPQ